MLLKSERLSHLELSWFFWLADSEENASSSWSSWHPVFCLCQVCVVNISEALELTRAPVIKNLTSRHTRPISVHHFNRIVTAKPCSFCHCSSSFSEGIMSTDWVWLATWFSSCYHPCGSLFLFLETSTEFDNAFPFAKRTSMMCGLWEMRGQTDRAQNT